MKKFIFLLLTATSIVIKADYARDLHRYFTANIEQFNGNMLKAQRWYNDLIKNPSSIYTYKGYVHFLNSTGQQQKIVDLVPKLEKKFEKDPDIQLLFAQAFKKIGKNTEGDDRLIRLSQTYKQHPEIVLSAAEAQIQRKELKNALNTVDAFLNSSPQKPNFFIFYFLKAQIYAQMQQFDNALTQVKKSLKLQPNFQPGWLFTAVLEEQKGNYAQAIKGLTTYLEKSGTSNAQIERHLISLTLKQFTSQNQQPFLVINLTCYQKALHLFKQKKYSQALVHVDQCLKQKPTDEESRLLKIQILVALQKADQAIEHLTQWSLEPNADLWLKTLHILVRANAPIPKVINAIKTVHAKKPNELMPILYLADLFTRSKQPEQAITFHKKALEKTGDNILKTKIYFQLGLLYYDQKNYNLMQKTLEQGEALHMDFPPLLNLLAYHYATKGKQVTKADELINRALKKVKNNPHFLDTKAVVLYKQGKFDKAAQLLEKIAQKNQNDSTILIHLAKAQHKQGQQERAQATIQAAKTSAKHAQERDTIKKLSERWHINVT